MISPLKFKLITLITFLLFSFAAQAWGPLGHEVVGHIAESTLGPLAKQKIKAILATTSMATASIWADKIKDKDDPENQIGVAVKPWHYINISKNSPLTRIIHSQNGDVIFAIKEITACLVKLNQPKIDLQAKCTIKNVNLTQPQLIKLLAHFVGDLHQPLHAGYAEDEGGNEVPLKFNGKDINLHSLWDSGLTEYKFRADYVRLIPKYAQLTYYKKMDAIADELSPGVAKTLLQKPPKDCQSLGGLKTVPANPSPSANPSTKKAVPELDFIKILKEDKIILVDIYNSNSWLEQNDPQLTTKYFDTFYPNVECQLYKGGLRLAELLNAIYKN